MAAVTENTPAFEDPVQGNEEYSAAVQAMVDWCGPCGGFLELDAAFRRSGLGEPGHDAPDSTESRFLGRVLNG